MLAPAPLPSSGIPSPGIPSPGLPSSGLPPADPPTQKGAGSAADDARRRRLTLLLFGGSAGAILVVGVVVLLIAVLTGEHNPLRDRYAAPPDTRPPLAQLCPPPTGPAGTPAVPAAPPPAGPRTTDREAGISYREYGEPWLPWRDRWSAGTLQVLYAIGQHFVTETYPGGTYHASILSGRVPATVNDAVSIDLECTGRQVAADVRASYYPQPNRMEMLRDEQAMLGGRPAWVSKFRLHFTERGLKATSELVAVALIDVGRPEAAILYVSIPNTVPRQEWVVDDVLTSVRPT